MKSTQDNKQAVMSAMSNIKCDWFEGFPMFIQPETCSTAVAHDIRHQRKMAAMWTLMCWIIHPQTKRRLLRGITVLVTRCSDFLESYRHVEVDRCGIIVPSEIDTCPHCLYLATIQASYPHFVLNTDTWDWYQSSHLTHRRKLNTFISQNVKLQGSCANSYLSFYSFS